MLKTAALGLLALTLAAHLPMAAAGQNPIPSDHFEQRVRPLLLAECASCHGAATQQAGIRFDIPFPGTKEQKSRLIARVKRVLQPVNGGKQMPPSKPLNKEQTATLLAWLDSGATFPAVKKTSSPNELWSVKPLTPLKLVSKSEQPPSVIDRLIQARLIKSGLSPAKPADRYTLLRRMSYDITGLPPTFDASKSFENDRAPNATSKRIKEMLASTAFGEHFARKWLDLARYADTKGYVYTEERRYAFAYTYRDWVVDAFNRDLPYNDFLRLQLAADRYPATPTKDLAALGFLTVGRRFVNNIPDVIDDRIDVIMRTTQGLTVACARCHDHKFDPIPTKDYYALYGVLAQSADINVKIGPLSGTPDAQNAYTAKRQAALTAFSKRVETERGNLASRLRSQLPRYMEAVPNVASLPSADFYIILGKDDINPFVVRRLKTQLDQAVSRKSRIFALWDALGIGDDTRFKAQAPRVLARLKTDTAFRSQFNSRIVDAILANLKPDSTDEAAGKIFGDTLAAADVQWQAAINAAQSTGKPLPTALPDPETEEIRGFIYGSDSVFTVPEAAMNELEWLFDEPTRVDLNRLKMAIDTLDADSPAAPDHAMALSEAPRKAPQRIYRRGDPRLPAGPAPAAFLTAMPNCAYPSAVTTPGRRELAESIISNSNPLTARVYVNRIWGMLFGRGLVATQSDFGTRGALPSHPELLDFLATEFVKHKWSTKWLVETILNTKTYQQASTAATIANKKDPDNTLLSHMPVRRLTFEQVRDTLLWVSSSLDTTAGGRSGDIFPATLPARRSLYATIDRQFVPGVLRAFDFANPDQHTPERHETTTAQQALFLLNHPFAGRITQALVDDCAKQPSGTAAVTKLYERVLQRKPAIGELAVARKAGLADTPPERNALAAFAQALVMSNRVLFVE
jgi:cytochrome c553